MRWCAALFLPLFMQASNLAEFIDLSLHNESYEIKELQKLQALNEKQSTLREYLPSLSLQGGYTNQSKDFSPLEARESLYTQITLKALLFDGGKREFSLKAKENAIILSTLASEQMQNYLALNATTLFFNYQSLQNIIEASMQKQNHLKHTLDMLERLYEAGLKPLDELESIRAKYSLASLELSQNKFKLLELQSSIKELSLASFVPQGKAFLKEPHFNEKSKNTEVLMAKEKIDLARAELNIARAEYYPKFFLQNDYTFLKNDYDIDKSILPAGLDTFLSPFEQRYMKKYAQNNRFLAGFEWKIFSFKATKKKVENKKLELLIQNLNTQQAQRKNELELGLIKDELGLLKEQITALTYTQKASDLAFESVAKKYQAGLSSYNDYLGALEAKFKAKSDLELAINTLEITKARYYFKAGLDIKERIE